MNKELPLLRHGAAQPTDKNRHGHYTPEHQQIICQHEAMRRNWDIDYADGLFVLTDSAGLTVKTYYDGRVVSCGCAEYTDRDVGTCMHGEMLKLYRIELKDQIKYSGKSRNVVGVCGTLDGVRAWCRRENAHTTVVDRKDDVSGLTRLPGAEDYLADTALGYGPPVQGTLNVLPGVTLRPYQEESVLKMLDGKRSVLTLKMGLGKTFCALTCIKVLGKKRVMVVCPASLKFQWKGEIERFLGHTPHVLMSSKDVAKVTDDGRIVVVNYELLVRNPSFMTGWDIVVMDEIQRVRNKRTKLWQSMSSVETEYVMALSGTVIENRVEDLLSVIDILNPLELRPSWRFCRDYCTVTHTKVRGFRPERVDALRRRLKRYVVNPDVSQLNFPVPVRVDHDVVTDFSSVEQRSAHDEPFVAAKLLMAMGERRLLTFGEQNRLNGLLTKARLASNDLRLITPTAERGAKVKAIREVLESLGGRKVVVYSDWIKMLKLVEQELLDMGVRYRMFTGEMSLKARNASFEKFVNDPSIKVFLATDTGGVGIDGLQYVSDAVIHTEMAWNPAKIDQRSGRVARALNPKSVVDVYTFRTGVGVEDMMVHSGMRKSEMRKSFLG